MVEKVFVLCIGIGIFAFIQRSLIRLIYPHHRDFDTYFHLVYIDTIRKLGLNIKEIKRTLIPQEGLVYPWLFHYLLSFLPKTLIDKYERFINPLLDSLYTCFIFFIAYNLTNSLEQSLYVVLIYIFSPIFFSVQSTGPRIKSLTPRLFGEILVSIIFIFEFLYFTKHSGVELIIISSFIGSLIFVTSKFSSQAFLFISIGIAIIYKKILPLEILLFSILLSILLFRKRVIVILSNQIEHLIGYYIENIKGKMHVSERNSIKFTLQVLKSMSIENLYKYFFYHNTFTIVFLKFPLFWLALYYIFFKDSFNSLFLKELELSEYFIGAGFISFIFTSLKPFLFLGEAERYLIHVSFFVLFYLSFYMSPLFIYVICAYGILFQVIDIIFCLVKTRKSDLTMEDEDRVINLLNSYSTPKNVLTIPFHLGGWRILYETSHNWFYHIHLVGVLKKKKEWDKIIEKYPFVKLENLPYIADRYNVDLIFIHKKLTGNDRLKKLIIPPSFVKKEINGILILEKK